MSTTDGSAQLGLGDMRSWMGAQADSRKETAPQFSLVGKPNAARQVQLSPGPIYLPSPRGRMGDGPKFSFGGAAGGASHRGGAAPGPGEYEPNGAVGATSVLSGAATAPSYGWGTGGREQAPIGSAPRSACNEFYEQVGAVGPQPTSNKRTVSAYAFAHQPRFDMNNKTLNPNARNPGPGAYKTTPASGPQVDSTLRSQPIAGFSRAERFKRPTTSSAGGQAPLPRPSFGPQVISDFKSKPSFGFGSARRFPDRPKTSGSTPGPGSYNA